MRVRLNWNVMESIHRVKSRHINIRFFFIKDVIKRECITIEHCPTIDMIADFFTKPLQGSGFVRLRDFLWA